MNDPSRAVIYCRVSTEEQASGTSLDTQLERCRAHAASRAWSVFGEFVDDGVSGALAERPALDRVMKACRDGDTDVVLVARLDRFGRSMRHLASTLGTLDDLGVALMSVSEGFDSSTAAGRLQRNILGSFAEFERELIVERCATGLRARVRAGWWPGGPAPYGYRLVREGANHRLEVDEGEAEAIRTAVAVLVDERGTTSDAARVLNTLGFRPRRAERWKYNHLRRFLLGAQLTGIWLYGRKTGDGRSQNPTGAVIPLSIPPILTPERQLALFERLEASRLPRQPKAKQRFYLLARGVMTSPCGRRYHGMIHNGTNRRKYLCPGRPHYLDDICHCRTIDADLVELAVWDSVTALLTDPVRLACCRAGEEVVFVGSRPDLREQVRTCDDRIADAERVLTRAAVELVRAGLSSEVIRSSTHELSGELEEAKDDRRQLLERLHEATDPARLDRYQAAGGLVSARLSLLDERHRRAVLEMLAVHINVTGWHTCTTCEGHGKLKGGRGGQRCPDCGGSRYVAELDVRGWWAEDAYAALAAVGDRQSLGSK